MPTSFHFNVFGCVMCVMHVGTGVGRRPLFGNPLPGQPVVVVIAARMERLAVLLMCFHYTKSDDYSVYETFD